MILPGITCRCGATELAALEPGQDPVRSAMPLFDVLLDGGRPAVGRCMACLRQAFPALREVASG